MAIKVLKKIENDNALVVLGLQQLYREYNEAQTDEALAKVIHAAFTAVEGSSIFECLVYDLLQRTLNTPLNPLYFEMVMMIDTHNNSINNHENRD